MEYKEKLYKIRRFLKYTEIDSLITKKLTSYYQDIKYIDPELYKDTRKNLEIICEQINECYSFGIYDGCAVLIRKAIEMLLIMSFKNYGIEDEIKNNGEYIQLSGIINCSYKSAVIDLSKSAKESLNPIRQKGNLSAHNPFYTSRKSDLDKYNDSFRQIFEELLHKAGIVK